MNKSSIKFKYFILSISFFFIFISCNNNVVYKESIKIPDNVWDMNNIAQFKPTIDSINTPYNVYLNIRHANMYPSQNLWLFISTTTPTGATQVDTFECILADDKGKWFGDGAGDIWDVEIPYKQNIAFPIAGEYNIKIQHGMRLENLPLIMEIGISIEKIDIKETGNK
jgi:gliding motility-associated lipoprotein GldH